MSPRDIKSRLICRGIKLNPPADHSDILKLESIIKKKIPKEILDIYDEFDGFKEGDFDVDSYVCVWPIKRIIINTKYDTSKLLFADIALDANRLSVLVENNNSLVENIDTGEILSNSFNDFWINMIKNDLSF